MGWVGPVWGGWGLCGVGGACVVWVGPVWGGWGLCGMGGACVGWVGPVWGGWGLCGVDETSKLQASFYVDEWYFLFLSHSVLANVADQQRDEHALVTTSCVL